MDIHLALDIAARHAWLAGDALFVIAAVGVACIARSGCGAVMLIGAGAALSADLALYVDKQDAYGHELLVLTMAGGQFVFAVGLAWFVIAAVMRARRIGMQAGEDGRLGDAAGRDGR
jgi:hypothetical protein